MARPAPASSTPSSISSAALFHCGIISSTATVRSAPFMAASRGITSAISASWIHGSPADHRHQNYDGRVDQGEGSSSVRHRPHGPALQRINARDQDLPVREFHQAGACPGMQRRRPDTRRKRRLACGPARAPASSRNRRSPRRSRLQHMRSLQKCAAGWPCRLPSRNFLRAPQQRGHRRVPGRRHRACKSAGAHFPAGNNPAIACGRADARVLKRSDEFPQPASRVPHV